LSRYYYFFPGAVTGSIPVAGSKNGSVAQLEERRSPTPKVSGSIPAASAILIELNKTGVTFSLQKM
jgi:hypothetical protein